MKRNGFTLIELLAVIIILAIVALIATPIVLNVVEDAKRSAAKSEANMIISGIQNNCATLEMTAQLQNDATLDTCADEAITAAEVGGMINLGNATVTDVTLVGNKVQATTIVSNGYTIVVADGATAEPSK